MKVKDYCGICHKYHIRYSKRWYKHIVGRDIDKEKKTDTTPNELRIF
jgi:hypothetical protein